MLKVIMISELKLVDRPTIGCMICKWEFYWVTVVCGIVLNNKLFFVFKLSQW